MAASWYYSVDGEKAGPVETSELRKLAALGILKQDDLVWKKGLPKWISARQIEGLFVDAAMTFVPTESIVSSQSKRRSTPVTLYLGGAAVVLIAVSLLVLFNSGVKTAPTQKVADKKAIGKQPHADVPQPVHPNDKGTQADPRSTEVDLSAGLFGNRPPIANEPVVEDTRQSITKPNRPMNVVIEESPAAKNDGRDKDDPIPPKIREYLERAERIRLNRLEFVQKKIADLKFEVTNARPQMKGEMKRQLSVAEKNLTNLTKFREPIAPLPVPMEVGDIGYHEVLYRVSILGDTAIAARMHDLRVLNDVATFEFHLKPNVELRDDLNSAVMREFIVTSVDSSRISKLPADASNQRIWQCKAFFKVASLTPDSALLMRLPEQLRDRLKGCAVLEPIGKSAEIESYRDAFYERKRVQEPK